MTKRTRTALITAAIGLLALLPAVTVQAQMYAIRGGRVHTLAGPVIENGTVIIRDGRIAAVGANVEVPADAEVVDATGLEVYPGLFDPLSRLGLQEIGSVSATEDMTERGEFNPQLVAATAVHPASEHIPVARANGITHAVASPGEYSSSGRFRGPLLTGQASAIHLSGWTIEEMLIRRSVGLVVNWPTFSTRWLDEETLTFKRRTFPEAKKAYKEKLAELDEWVEAARHYALAAEGTQNLERNAKLEALAPVTQGRLPIIVVANDSRLIEDALDFAERHGLRMILAGGAEAWKLKDRLAEKGVPVILRPTQALPGERDEPYDRPFTTPGELHRAGVRVAFATFDAADSRTLPYEAANAVPYGLPHEEALRGVTLYPADILGLGDELGSIEKGKLANLIVTDGDPLEIQTRVLHVFIQGEPTSTDNRHRQLYDKYRSRPSAAH
jgi:imidazolonepropionase-like amidohydrolase